MISSEGSQTNVRVATANLNQWALDFEGNKKRIIQSIKQSKEKGCSFRLGSELELCGYSCEDHFFELDTVTHSWEMLADIIKSGVTQDIICCFGMPAVHRDVMYNCNVVVFNKSVELVRPKLAMADDGNYREGRFFTAWSDLYKTEVFELPSVIKAINGQTSTIFGNAVIETYDTEIGIETCEELWLPNSTNILMGLEGVEIFANNSGSHHELRKLGKRIGLMTEATKKNGGCYIYANQRGCDGGRLYFDGSCMIVLNGDIVAMGSQFSLKDVEVCVATVDLNKIRTLRMGVKSRALQAQNVRSFKRVRVPIRLARYDEPVENPQPLKLEDMVCPTEEEIANGPACYLWDYLRRSGASGFFLPLSGGSDSAATATLVFNMSRLAYEAIVKDKNEQVLADLHSIVRDKSFQPKSPQEIVKRIFFTAYLGSDNSSEQTKKQARDLSEEIGANHFELSISKICAAFTNSITKTFNKEPKFVVHGGSESEDLALQNIQARARMIQSYLCAQLIPAKYTNGGFILVLGSANLDEGLRGYCTKYDCSSADMNPIGSLSKVDLKRFLKWSVRNLGIQSLNNIINAVPTAELRPLDEKNKNYVQTDEADMGMSYQELSIFGSLRKNLRQGPVSMFRQLASTWKELKLSDVSEKVKRFFKFYSINRHKMTTMTPAVHAEGYSADDNRFDMRQLLYNTTWDYQFLKIDKMVLEGRVSDVRETKQKN